MINIQSVCHHQYPQIRIFLYYQRYQLSQIRRRGARGVASDAVYTNIPVVDLGTLLRDGEFSRRETPVWDPVWDWLAVHPDEHGTLTGLMPPQFPPFGFELPHGCTSRITNSLRNLV